jgi:RNA polymerase sigma-70 factor, ECF subfamily
VTLRVGSDNSATGERALLRAAQRGDEHAFRELVETHRAQVHAHCYRMLGSLHDAEDAFQDTLLRAWRALPRFRADSSLPTWLYRIATNVCLDAIARRSPRVLPLDHGPPAGIDQDPGEPLDDAVWIEPYPDEALGVADGYAAPEARYEQREAVELAFIAALQHLPPRQRAALILCEVLGFSAREVAEALDSTTASVNSALQRARRAIDERLPSQSQQLALRALGDEGVRELVERFSSAFEGGDVEAIVAMLADDATFAMPPYSSWYRGRDAVAQSWLMPSDPDPRLRYVPTRANGQLALGAYSFDPQAGRYLPIALDVLTLRRGEIVGVTAFRSPEIFPRFGLPEQIDEDRSAGR